MVSDPQPTITLLQHVECESGGWFEEWAAERRVGIRRVRLHDGEPVPVPDTVEALVVMGGPMGALDDRDHPWLGPERALIAAAVGADKPYWGVCLGAQLLAAALGAAVVTGPNPEVGISAVALRDAAAADAVFRHVSGPLTALHWHADTFDLPPGGVLLASTAAYPQAFRVRNAWGLQFHIESSRQATARWLDLPAYQASLAASPGAWTAPRLLDSLAEEEAAMAALARRLFDPWLDLVTRLTLGERARRSVNSRSPPPLPSPLAD